MRCATKRGHVITALLAMVVLSLLGCGPGGSDGALTSSAASGESGARDSTTTGSPSVAPSVTTSASPTTPPLTPADPSIFADSTGGQYAFSLADSFGIAGCWFYEAAGPFTPSESIRCHLPLSDQTPVWDPFQERSGTPIGVAIDIFGANKITWFVGADGVPTLPVGSSLTVGNQMCEVPTATSLRCSGTHGEFVYDAGNLSIERSDRSPEVGNAGLSCGPIDLFGEQASVVVVRGPIECPEALSTIEEYVNLPDDGNYGNANVREVGAYTCSTPTAATSEQERVTIVCGDANETTRFVVPRTD